MSHRIGFHFESDHILSLSETEKNHLNQIYYTSMWHRPLKDVYLKYNILILVLVGLLKASKVTYEIIRKKVSRESLLIIFVAVEISLFTSYISFLFISNNNVFKTAAFHGHKGCMLLTQARLEIARYVVFTLSENLTRWLALCLGLANVNHNLTLKVVYFINSCFSWCAGKIQPIKLFFFQMFVLFILLYSPIFAVRPRVHEYSLSNHTCYEWVSDLEMESGYTKILHALFEEVIPYLLTFVCYVIIFAKSKMYRKWSAYHGRPEGIQKNTSSCVVRILVVDLVFTLPYIVLHFLKVTNNYHPGSYLLDEALCDLIDALILVNTNFIVYFYYKMVLSLDLHKNRKVSFAVTVISPNSVLEELKIVPSVDLYAETSSQIEISQCQSPSIELISQAKSLSTQELSD